MWKVAGYLLKNWEINLWGNSVYCLEKWICFWAWNKFFRKLFFRICCSVGFGSGFCRENPWKIVRLPFSVCSAFTWEFLLLKNRLKFQRNNFPLKNFFSSHALFHKSVSQSKLRHLNKLRTSLNCSTRDISPITSTHKLLHQCFLVFKHSHSHLHKIFLAFPFICSL